VPTTVHPAHPTLSLDEEAIRATVERVAAGEGLSIVELSVVLGDHGMVRELNREWLGHDYDTDVLSFPLHGGDAPGSSLGPAGRREIDGEIYVDLDTAAERAPEFGVTMETEALRYVVHGLLHLMGYDDSDDANRAAMRALEDRYLVIRD
jgi:rRNA maturation RNase YbeY